jgi:hypothetical protein
LLAWLALEDNARTKWHPQVLVERTWQEA